MTPATLVVKRSGFLFFACVNAILFLLMYGAASARRGSSDLLVYVWVLAWPPGLYLLLGNRARPAYVWTYRVFVVLLLVLSVGLALLPRY